MQCPVFRKAVWALLGQIEYLQFAIKLWRIILMWPCDGGHSTPPCAMFE